MEYDISTSVQNELDKLYAMYLILRIVLPIVDIPAIVIVVDKQVPVIYNTEIVLFRVNLQGLST